MSDPVTIPQAIELIKRKLAMDAALQGLPAVTIARQKRGLPTEPMPELTTAIRELLAEMGLGVRLVLEGPGRVQGVQFGEEHWVLDTSSSECELCRAVFTTTRRRVRAPPPLPDWTCRPCKSEGGPSSHLPLSFSSTTIYGPVVVAPPLAPWSSVCAVPHPLS